MKDAMPELSTNLIKFVSVRPSVSIDFSAKNDTMIVDGRFWKPEIIPSERDVNVDIDRASTCYPAQFVLRQIESFLPLCKTSRDVLKRNDKLVEMVRIQFGIDEKPGISYVYELSDVIARHAQIELFDQNKLVRDIENILTRELELGRSITLDEYVYLEADEGSHYCIALRDTLNHLYTLYIAKRHYSINLEFVLNAIRTLYIIFCLASRPRNLTTQISECASILLSKQTNRAPAVMDQERLNQLMEATVCVHPIFSYLIAYYRPFNLIQPVGIGDLKVVKQWLCKYEAAEVAHVENVMLGETKNRIHRSLNRTEQVSFSAEQTVEETKKDLETTDRYELVKEVESTMQQELGLELAGTVSGSYGVTEFSVSSGISYSQSSSDSMRSVSNFAKDVVSKATSRIERTVRQERTLKILAETEETNDHGFDNKGGTGHAIGIYRWLQKRYKAQVFNYGRRLMFEVLVPEPAAFVKYATEKNKSTESGPTLPEPPPKPQIAISTLDQATIDTYSELILSMISNRNQWKQLIYR